jgi:hypothetical protein
MIFDCFLFPFFPADEWIFHFLSSSRSNLVRPCSSWAPPPGGRFWARHRLKMLLSLAISGAGYAMLLRRAPEPARPRRATPARGASRCWPRQEPVSALVRFVGLWYYSSSSSVSWAIYFDLVVCCSSKTINWFIGCLARWFLYDS